MSVPLTLLGLLEREPSHGYDLKRGYDARCVPRKLPGAETIGIRA